MGRRTLVCALAGLALVSSACTTGDTGTDSSTSSTSSPEPTTTTTISTTTTSTTTATTTTDLPATDAAELAAHAVEFSDTYHRSWPDIDLALERFAENVVFYDPADGDFIIEGGDVIVPILRQFAAYFPNVEPVVEEVFVSADGASYRVRLGHGYWPPWSVEPADHPPVVELDVFHFEGDSVTGLDIWFEDHSLETLGFGCLAIDGCPDLVDIVEGYVTAWTSREPDQIASLYDDNAVFTDSLLGIEAVGPDEISSVAAARFGEGEVTVEVVEVYAQTNGPEVPTDGDRDVGGVIAVGIHYLVSSSNADTASYESLTTFELGIRQSNGFNPHPEGLITHEEVFHNTDALATIIP